MTETRGYQTINDRTDGWGPGVDEDLQPDADAAKESTATRVARLKVARKSGNAGVTPDTHDRTRGKGGEFDPTDGADGGYDVKDWEGSDATVGTDYDVEYTGSNTNMGTTGTDVLATGRTAKALPTSDLVEPDIETVGSIVDRTSGWGHEDGSQADRKDS